MLLRLNLALELADLRRDPANSSFLLLLLFIECSKCTGRLLAAGCSGSLDLTCKLYDHIQQKLQTYNLTRQHESGFKLHSTFTQRSQN